MERLLKVCVLITCFTFVRLRLVFVLGVYVSVCDFSACWGELEPAMYIFISVYLLFSMMIKSRVSLEQ